MQIEIFIRKAGMQPQKQIKIKRGPGIKHFVAHQMQKYLTQKGPANFKNHILMNLD